MTGQFYRRAYQVILGTMPLLIVALAVLFMPIQAAAAPTPAQGVHINISQSVTVDHAHPAKVIDIELDAKGKVIVHTAKDVSVGQAEAIAGQGNGKQNSKQANISGKGGLPTAVNSTATCHTYQAVLDPVNIVLTSVQHDLNWTYNGSTVSLNWINTTTNYHITTGWSLVSGPSQWVVSGNKTHGEATFQWIAGQHNHTHKNDNQANANGTCLGTMQIVGTIPAISHISRSVWVTP